MVEYIKYSHIIYDMNIFARLKTIEEFDKSKAVKKIIEESTPDFDYYLMLVLSTVMATLGLLAGSETTVIGAMLLAPLLAPTLGLALGMSMSEQNLISRSFFIIVRSTMVAVVAAVLATFLFALFKFDPSHINETILSRTSPSLLYFMIAAISGFAVAYASVRPQLSESLPGVAIAVALIPPLSVVGIGLGVGAVKLVSGALFMYIINVLGIVFAAMTAFSLMDVHHKRFMAEKLVEKETERLKQEKEELQKAAEEIKDRS